jgi:hypothetical protein
MVRVRSLLCAVFVVALLAIGVFVIAPAVSNTNQLTVTFYDVHGVAVGSRTANLGLAILWQGVEVTSFSVTLRWATDDPSVAKVSARIWLVVWISASQGASQAGSYDLLPDQTVAQSTGQAGTGTLSISSYVSGVPAGPFLFEFRGRVIFKTSAGAMVQDVAVNPVNVSMERTPYTYTAYVEPGAG